jgi:hypothetical protein
MTPAPSMGRIAGLLGQLDAFSSVISAIHGNENGARAMALFSEFHTMMRGVGRHLI